MATINPLIDACMSNQLNDVISLLDEYDPSDNNNQAIDVAVENGCLEIVRLLMNDSRITPTNTALIKAITLKL